MWNNFLNKIQSKPYETRVKILWITTTIAAICLVAVWAVNLKAQIKNFSPKPEGQNQTIESAPRYASVDRAEITNNEVKIFFKINNNTTNILNVSKKDYVRLEIDGKIYTPIRVTNRQGNDFVAKVLSHTEEFGILIFENIQGNSGKLTFDQLSFEGETTIFRESFEINLDKLNQTKEIRS